MILEVVSPEATLFSGAVNSVAVPGANGAFQVLDNHAQIVSILNPGTVKIGGKISLLWHPHTLTKDYGWDEDFNMMLEAISDKEL